MKVLVTGHQGYLGTVMVPLLHAAGHDVVGLDNGYFADCILGAAPTEPPCLVVDLRDVTVDQLRGFDAVVHLAALSDDPRGALPADITYDINHHASVRLALLAKEAGVGRFLFASTCSEYGSAGTDLASEEAELHPVTSYAISKVRVEADVAGLADADFVPVFLRSATAFGFSPRFRTDTVLNGLVGQAVLTGVVRVMSDGASWRPLVHAQDVARAFETCLTAPAEIVSCRAYNVGAEANNVTVAEIARTVVDTVPGSTLLITGEAGSDRRSCRVDFSRARAELDFEATWSVADGVAELYEAYLANGVTGNDFDESFTRVKRLDWLIAHGVVDETMRRVSATA